MLRLYTFCFAALLLSILASAQTFPRDYFGDQHRSANGWMTNAGQKLGTNMVPAVDLFAYTDGYGMGMWLLDKATFKLSKTVHDTVPGNNDTTFCVSIKAAGPNANGPEPEPYLPLPGKYNFYYPHTGTSAEEVLAYHRWVYWEVWSGISMQFYTSGGGPKLAFVCEPGSDPSEILLQCNGQDSLHLDISGALEMYIKDRWFILPQAIAYQLDAQGNMVSLPWYPEWNESNTNGQLNFNFGSFDPTKVFVLQIGGLPLGAWEPDEPRNMQWSTYAGSDNSDEFMANDVDANGDAYATGYTYQSNFPVGTGFQVFPPSNPAFAGSEDVVTMKFQADNKQIAWATYQGGGGQATDASDEWRGLDKAYDMTVYKGEDEELEYAFVTGSTVSTDFPVYTDDLSPFIGADETSFEGGTNGYEHAAFILAYDQFNGQLVWSTTLGPTSNDAWVADGLGVDIHDDGTLVWSGRVSETPPSGPGSFTYPFATPSGAFTRADGGGFFVLFDPAYQVLWNTFFGSKGAESGVFDVKIANVGPLNERKAFLTGVTSAPSPPIIVGLDVFQPSGATGFYQPSFGGGFRDAYFAMLNLETYQLEYSSYWGGNGDDYGIALEVFATSPHNYKWAWVGGLSKSTDLVLTELPAPGTGGLHQTTNAGDADAMLLCFSTIPEMDLIYGTLYGGAGPDAIFDLEAGSGCTNASVACQIYATGETGSASGIVQTSNPELYQQDVLGNSTGSTKRDALLLAMKIYDRIPIWTTYIGGARVDKGWGVAASASELYLVGGTVSDQLTFPLKEFDLSAPEDWYDGDLLNNINNGFQGNYSFSNRHFYQPFAGTTGQIDPWPGISHDAYIASFGISPMLLVPEVAVPGPLLRPQLIAEAGLWSVAIPSGMRVLRLYEPTGRLVEERLLGSNERAELIDLRSQAAGVYAITCSSADGVLLSAKLLKP